MPHTYVVSFVAVVLRVSTDGGSLLPCSAKHDCKEAVVQVAMYSLVSSYRNACTGVAVL